MTHSRSVTLIVPQAQADNANKVAWAMGHQSDPAGGNNTFSVRLSATGSEPATHLGAHSYERPDGEGGLLTDFQNAKRGSLPALSWGDFGLTEGQATAAVSVMDIFDDLKGNARTNFNGKLVGKSLQRVIVP